MKFKAPNKIITDVIKFTDQDNIVYSNNELTNKPTVSRTRSYIEELVNKAINQFTGTYSILGDIGAEYSTLNNSNYVAEEVRLRKIYFNPDSSPSNTLKSLFPDWDIKTTLSKLEILYKVAKYIHDKGGADKQLITNVSVLSGGSIKYKKKKTLKKKKTQVKKRKIHKGPRGGKYYISKGRKVYV